MKHQRKSGRNTTEKKPFSRKELLPDKLKEYAKEVRERIKIQHEKYPLRHDDIAQVKRLLNNPSDADVPSDLSENFRRYLYRTEPEE